MEFLIKTPRLILKPSTLDDFENTYAHQSDLDTMRYIHKARDREEVKASLDKSILHYQKHGFSIGSVFEKETGAFIGRAGLFYLGYDDTQTEIEVGYILNKKFWGKGYATELAKAIIEWGFQHLPINKLIAVIHPENEKSRHVIKKTGMEYVGRIYLYDKENEKYEIHRVS